MIKSVGIFAPDELLRELVDQAEGRPGLAVTLAHLCLHGGVREVVLGDALNRSIGATFGPLVGQRATELLAGFAIGGASVMGMQAVTQLFGFNLLQVRRDIARLAAGGVVLQLPEDRLIVRPEGLRHTLVRDLFFRRGFSMPVQPFIDAAPNASEVARTLIGARGRGAAIPNGLLLAVLEGIGRSAPWNEYAALGWGKRLLTCYIGLMQMLKLFPAQRSIICLKRLLSNCWMPQLKRLYLQLLAL